MTVLTVENGTWVAKESKLGYATLRRWEGTGALAIYPDEWVYGYLPDSAY